MSAALLFGMLWSLALLVAYLYVPRQLAQRITANADRSQPNRMNLVPSRSALAVGALASLALFVRLVPNFALPMGAGYDIQSFQLVGDLLIGGENVFINPLAENRYPYLPFQMYWSAFSLWSANQFHLPFVKIVRLLPIAADLAIVLVLYATLLRTAPPEKALYAGLAYALNPIPIYVSAYHGQFDALPALSILLALAWIARSPPIAASWLGFGILSKSWPVLALPSLLNAIQSRRNKWRKQLLFLAIATLIPCLGIVLYLGLFHASLPQVLLRALSYNRGIGVWGYTYFLALLSNADLASASFVHLKPWLENIYLWFVSYGRFVTLGGLGLVWWVKARRQSHRQSFLTILVVFFAITHAFAIQYLMWIVPFALLCSQTLPGQASADKDRPSAEEPWLRRYTLAAFAYMFLAYNTLILETHITNLLPWPLADRLLIIPAGLPAWFVCLGWARERLRA